MARSAGLTASHKLAARCLPLRFPALAAKACRPNLCIPARIGWDYLHVSRLPVHAALLS